MSGGPGQLPRRRIVQTMIGILRTDSLARSTNVMRNKDRRWSQNRVSEKLVVGEERARQEAPRTFISYRHLDHTSTPSAGHKCDHLVTCATMNDTLTALVCCELSFAPAVIPASHMISKLHYHHIDTRKLTMTVHRHRSTNIKFRWLGCRDHSL